MHYGSRASIQLYSRIQPTPDSLKQNLPQQQPMAPEARQEFNRLVRVICDSMGLPAIAFPLVSAQITAATATMSTEELLSELTEIYGALRDAINSIRGSASSADPSTEG